MLHLGIVFNKELASKGAMAASARTARDAGGVEVIAMSAGGGLEDAGLADRESDATNTGVTGLRMAVAGACHSKLQHLDSLHSQPSTPAQISRERNILDSRGTHLELVKAS